MRRNKQVRQSITLSAVLMGALFLLPLVVIIPFRSELFSGELIVDETEGAPFVSGALDSEMTLKVLDGDQVKEMDLGTYLVSVVRGEMPASFEMEALKAQTVAARTYTLYKIRSGGNHGDTAQICTNPACCQAYCSEEQAKKNWGKKAAAYEKKVEEAVRATDGQVILYGGAPILAVFHSCSAGRTRPAGEVWVNDLPYLQSVSSPEPGDRIPNYYSRAEFTAESFRQKMLAVRPEVNLSGKAETWLKNPVVDEAGSVESVTVGGVPMKGSAVRSALGLRSACFTWEVKGDEIVFFVTGYGHGVGLSQYGADQMAKDGADYREILTHYYTGVTVEPYRQG